MRNIKFLILFINIIYANHVFSEENYNIDIIPEIYKSKSGINFIIHKKQISKIVEMEFYFKNSGIIYEKHDQKGIINIATALLNRHETASIGINEFSKLLLQKGIAIIFMHDMDNIKVYIKCLSSDLDDALNYMVMLIGKEKKIDGNSFKITKEEIIDDININNKSIDYIAAKSLNNILLNPKDPYYSTNEHDIRKITRNDVNKFIDYHFNLKDLMVSIIGNVDKENFAKLLDKHLVLSSKGVNVNIKHFDHSTLFNEKKNKNIKFKGGDQYVISFALPTLYLNGKPNINSNNYYAQLLLINKLQRAGDGYLFKYLRGDNGLTYGSHADIVSNDNLQYIYGSLLTNNSNKSEVIKAFDKMLNDISHGVTKEELQAIKNTYIGSTIISLNSSAIADIMLDILENSYPLNFLSNFINNINKVTVSDINKVAKQLFDKNKLILVSVGEEND